MEPVLFTKFSSNTLRKRLRDVIEVDKPNLLRESSPYTSLTKVEFDGVRLDMNITKEICVTDTTFLDMGNKRGNHTVLNRWFHYMSLCTGSATGWDH